MIRFLSKAKAGEIAGTALVRLDFNTEDDWRMKAVVPTIQLLLKRADKIVVMSHRGRPKGVDAKLSLRKDAKRLEKLIKREVVFLPTFDFVQIKKKIAAARKGSVFLLENLRFVAGEEKNDAKFAKQLASLGDYYVNDAFAVSHRADASVVAITKFLPSFAGLELEKEIEHLGTALTHPQHPFVFIVGGAKAADKLAVIKYFRKRVDAFLLGGGAANTVLKVWGKYIGGSVADDDPKDVAAMAPIAKYSNIVMPEDYVWHDGKILDIGSRAMRQFAKKISVAKTILWSGTMGMEEKRAYAKGSMAILRAIEKNKKALKIVGGGETVEFVKQHKGEKAFTFISTGGGAMLDFLAGEKLAGIESLKKK